MWSKEYKDSRLTSLKEDVQEKLHNFVGNITGRRDEDNLVDESIHGKKFNTDMVFTWINHAIVISAGIIMAFTAQWYQVYFVYRAVGFDKIDLSKSIWEAQNPMFVFFIAMFIFVGVYIVSISVLIFTYFICYLVFLRQNNYGKDILFTGATISMMSFVILSLVFFIFNWHPNVFWIVLK